MGQLENTVILLLKDGLLVLGKALVLLWKNGLWPKPTRKHLICLATHLIPIRGDIEARRKLL
jgi:hypothetical protein